MNETKITRIDQLSETSSEVLLYLTDGNFKCQVFCHLCNAKEGDTINTPLLVVNPQSIKLSGSNLAIESQTNKFHHFIVGKLVKVRPFSIIQVGSILFEITDPIPNDLKLGDFVSFYCERLDFWS